MPTVLLFSTRDSICQSWTEALEGSCELIACKDEFDCITNLHSFPESIVLFHINSYEGDIAKFLKKVRYDYPGAHTMFLSDVPHFQEGIDLLRMGVNGYGNSYINQSHLQHALNVIADGNIWLYPKFLDILIKETYASVNNSEQIKSLSKLSKRERQIAEFVAQGLNNQEIAARTQITVRTVKAHITSIFEKLHLPDRLSLALFMRQIENH
jgi:DNA-binding NarL/FixJ family response regulator